MAPAERGILAKVLLDQEVIEQAHDREALLHRGKREATSRVKGEDGGSSGIGTVSQVLYIESHMFAGHRFGDEVLPGAERQEIIEAAPIRIDGFGCQLQVRLHV